MNRLKKQRRKPMSVETGIALVFLGIILLGTFLLCLPISSRDGQYCGVLTALFTATSSTCVTGLVTADTYTQWSGFGQIVILMLIEIGGLGFMSAVSLMIYVLRRKASMNQQLLIAQSIGSDGTAGALRLQRRILIGCLAVEGAGALLLTLRFLADFDFLTSLKLGVFHSISAFCNAGFDILGFIEPGGSMHPYGTDPAVILTLSALIVIGGVGFLVWDEIFREHKPKRWSVYTKLVLLTTGALLLFGTVAIAAAEWNNPATLGSMDSKERWLAAFFQSVTARTAGFAGMDQGALTDGGKAVTMALMLIGGSSGSTAGGLKTVTFVVLLLFLVSRLRGEKNVSVFCRTVPQKKILNALTLFGVLVVLSYVGATVIAATSPVGFTDGLYESISALATVGLTTGATAALSVPAKLLIIVYMYFGRVGIFTVSLGFLKEDKAATEYKYAETTLLIG